jgi:hypothetical protein
MAEYSIEGCGPERDVLPVVMMMMMMMMMTTFIS